MYLRGYWWFWNYFLLVSWCWCCDFSLVTLWLKARSFWRSGRFLLAQKLSACCTWAASPQESVGFVHLFLFISGCGSQAIWNAVLASVRESWIRPLVCRVEASRMDSCSTWSRTWAGTNASLWCARLKPRLGVPQAISTEVLDSSLRWNRRRSLQLAFRLCLMLWCTLFCSLTCFWLCEFWSQWSTSIKANLPRKHRRRHKLAVFHLLLNLSYINWDLYSVLVNFLHWVATSLHWRKFTFTRWKHHCIPTAKDSIILINSRIFIAENYITHAREQILLISR